MIEYEDFSLKIEPKQGSDYPVIVLRSPAGEGRSSFQLPFDPDEIGDMLFDLGQTVRGTGQTPMRDVSPAATRTGPQRIGDLLFQSLFFGPVRSLLDRSLGMIHGRQRGLRIKLHIDPEDASLAQLASLPWEFLYRKETRDFLNLSRFTPILRYLDVQRPYIPLSLDLPLRILVVISAPIDCAQLNLDRERALIETSWARQAGVQVDFIERATILSLQDRLTDQPYHVLHYMGHGDFDEATGQGVLMMEDDDGRGVLVDGSRLGVLLRDVPTLRLVFLNACETARVTREKGLDPFAGVAAAMVLAGIPAVVAMQFPISDNAAITFAQKFYSLLARGEPADVAVAEGRRAIRLAEARTMEWGTPVLFMRAPQGVIFRVSEAQRQKVPLQQIPQLPEEVDETLQKRLAELYTLGLSAFWLEEWEKAARSFQAIVEVQPDYEDAVAKLAEAKRQSRLHTLYTQARVAQEAEDWSAAQGALEELAAEAPDFRDTSERLLVCKKRKQLADLYAEAQRLCQASQWQAVVNVFVQIRSIEPDYADPDEILATAEKEVAEQKRLAELNRLYSRAVRGMNAKQWQEADQLLKQVQAMEPGYQETERLLARVHTEIEREEDERRQQEQIAALYEQALVLVAAEQWQQALEKLQEIQALDRAFADPKGVTVRAREEIERQERLDALYKQAQTARQIGDWSSARAVLEQLVAEDVSFRDAANLLPEVRRQEQLSDLYTETQNLSQAQEWQAVLGVFAQITASEPDYPDPDELLPTAQREIAAQERQAELSDLYRRATGEVEARRWTEAHQLLARLQEMEPGYHETERLLREVEAEIEREEVERQRQEQLATLYEQALGLARARQWWQVLSKVEEMQNLDPAFADPEGIAARAQEEVAREKAEARRQSELAALYVEAVRLLRAGQYQEALQTWGQVQAQDPRYPDRKKVQSTAKKKLATLAKGKPAERRRPILAYVTVGGLILVTVGAIIALGNGIFGRGITGMTPTAMPEIAAVAVAPTSTPQSTALMDIPPLHTQASLPPALGLRVLYSQPIWVESFYEPGHTVWITVAESDGETIKATARLVTESKDAWGGESGFNTAPEDWNPGSPGIVPYDWVYGSVDNGASAQLHIGSIEGIVDLEADAVRGTVNAPWFTDEVAIDCNPWGAPEPGTHTKHDSILPNGEDSYICSWFGEWNIQRGQDVGVGYSGPDGHWVANVFSSTLGIVASANGDFLWTNGWTPGASLTISVYESKAPGAALLWEGNKTADDNGFVVVEPSSDSSPDLQPGNYLTVSDGIVQKGLELESITIDIFDVDQDVIAGTAPPGREVRVTAATASDQEHQTRMDVTAGLESGEWTADFKTLSIDITEEMRPWSFAQVLDDDGDTSEAGTPPRAGSADYWRERGAEYFNLGEYEAAITDFNQAIALDPQNAGSYDERASAYEKMGKQNLALADWTQAGLLHRDQDNDFEAAIADFNQAIAIDPQNADLYNHRAGAYWNMNKPDLAIADMTKAIELDPSQSGYWLSRGLFYRDQGDGDDEAAIADFNQAIALDPQNADLYAERAQAYRNQVNFSAAINDLNKAIELNPQDWRNYWSRALAYREQGNYQNAIDDLSKAIELDPGFGGLYLDRGLVYHDHLGDSTSALSDLGKAIELEPSQPIPHFYRGLIYDQLGRVDEARVDYKKYLELADNEPSVDFRDEVQHWLKEHPE